MSAGVNQRIERVTIETYRIPTDHEESDGTLKWDHTGIVLARVYADETTGLGWSYAAKGAGVLAEEILLPTVVGQSAMDIEGIWHGMVHHLRNAGVPGAGMMGLSAIDIALWDLQAKLLGLSLLDLFGAVRNDVPIYGSGGFTNYTDAQLTEQFTNWVAMGIKQVKMKVGRNAKADVQRVRTARKVIGPDIGLFVDANGGYSRKEALQMAQIFREENDVTWFEEPRPSDDLEGLRLLRDRGPVGMDIAAGEYGDTLNYFRTMLEAGAVDCLQADVTRCGGYTGFLKVSALCEAFNIPLSAHCAPQLHAHVACACKPLRHVEYFHDHVRIEQMIFDGVLQPGGGKLCPDRGRVGHGLSFKMADAERYRIH